MFVEYEKISEDAKTWIYPSSRKFYDSEIVEIGQKVKQFIKSWKSEDENFKVSIQFLHKRFLILFADEALSPISNMDIDEMVSFILQLQLDYKVTLLDKMNVCFKQGEFVQYKELKSIKSLLKNKAITEKTIVFDNLITNKFDFENHWEIPLKDSWYNRFL